MKKHWTVFSHWPCLLSLAQPLSCAQAFISFLFMFLHSILPDQGCCTQQRASKLFHIITATAELNRLTGCSTSSQQFHANTRLLTLTSAEFWWWKGDRQGWWAHAALCRDELCQAFGSPSSMELHYDSSVLNTHLAYCAKPPFVLLRVSHPALERRAPSVYNLCCSKTCV